MFVKRENNPNRSEWIDELFQENEYCIVERKTGDFEVYKGRKLIARTESYEAAIEYIRMAQGRS